jgi:hypothetical protein
MSRGVARNIQLNSRVVRADRITMAYLHRPLSVLGDQGVRTLVGLHDEINLCPKEAHQKVSEESYFGVDVHKCVKGNQESVGDVFSATSNA